jgi:hypothetical protein
MIFEIKGKCCVEGGKARSMKEQEKDITTEKDKAMGKDADYGGGMYE